MKYIDLKKSLFIILLLFLLSPLFSAYAGGEAVGQINGSEKTFIESRTTSEDAEIYNGKLYDPHVHFTWHEKLSDELIDALISKLDAHGIDKILLMPIGSEGNVSWLDKNINNIFRRYPDRIFTFFGNFDATNPESLNYIRRQLDSGSWCGIGAIFLRHDGYWEIPADNPIVLQIFDLAAEYDVPVLINYMANKPEYVEEIRRALNHNLNTKILWVQSDDKCPTFLSDFPNLYCNLYFYNSEFPIHIDPIYYDRILIGSDLGLRKENGQWLIETPFPEPGFPSYIEFSQKLRESLGSLGLESAQNIAFRNLEGLVDLDSDGMPNLWEKKYGLDPLIDDSSLDPDGDGTDNYNEYLNGTDPKVSDDLRALVKSFVLRFYQLCLDRNPDPAGLDGWVTALLNATQTGSEVAYGFVLSQEFLNKNTTDEEYLQILYEAFFNRPPDPVGCDGWMAALEKGADREYVLQGFIYAKEFNELCRDYGIMPNPVAAFVTRFYQLCLKRDPDIAGLDGWVASLLSGENVGADVAEGFIFSPEFTKTIITHEGYITILYKAFFNRDPDPAGLQGWLDALNSGTTRAEVLDGFIYSKEFGELCEEYGITPFH